MIQQITIDKLKEEFLAKGILVRKATNKQGEPIIEHKSNITHCKWCTRLTFSTEDLRDKNFDYLTRKRKPFFKAE